YIIIDGLTIRGGKENVIRIDCASNIVVRNCDIASFGRLGELRTELGGEYYYRQKGGKLRMLNSDAGIYLRNAKDLLIEKNFIHDTNGLTNPWFYSHPAGPKAINAGMTANTTIRYNDFIGGDKHRWNDAIECQGNSSTVGGLYRNAEIYGNIFALSNDDGIELEGGEINTRFFGNRIENTLCGSSSGSCKRGPSYIFNNLFWRSGDQNYLSVAAFKNGHGVWGSGKVHIFNNTVLAFRSGIHPPGHDKYRTRLDKMEFFNNIFSLNNVGGANGLFKEAKSVSDHNFFNPESPLTLENYRKTYDQEHNSLAGDPKYVSAKDGNFFLSPSSSAIGAGKVLDNFTADSGVDMGAFQTSENKLLPLRELDFVTSLQALDFAFGDTAGRKIKLTATGKNVRIPFTIARTFEAQWLEVTPSKGVIESGKPVTLSIRVVPEKFRSARINNTVFLIRTPDGSSRPVTVSADSTGYEKLVRNDRRNVLFSEVINGKRTTEVSVNVKKPGYYFLMFYGKSGRGNATIYLNGKKLYTTKINASYQGINNKAAKFYFNLSNRQKKNMPIKLNAGKNDFKIVYNTDYKPEKAALITSCDEIMPAAWIR
ncbi:MAG: right-handed parallel beta-helix repeat-containing protein, partial [Lentisphaeria bacterium]|nr:right-handed parallel beta-helix repeat-containing protein [Lentisphaeria bacterium]